MADLDGFECQLCGNCCRVPGYVHLTALDIDQCAAFLEMDVEDFTEKYTRLTTYRTSLSLIENPDGSCVFLTVDNRCQIEPVKPEQCRQYPFDWHYQNGSEICPGWNNIRGEP
jgi:Fe-S-cluster containining protein